MRWPPRFSPPPLTTTAWLRPLAAGILCAATLRAAASTLGGAPLTLAGALGAAALGLSLGELLAGARAPALLAHPAARAGALLPALAVILADPLLSILGRLASEIGLGIGQIHGVLLVGGAICAGLALRGPWSGGAGLAGLGVLGGGLLPPLPAAILGGLGLALSLPAPGASPALAPSSSEPLGLRLRRALAVASLGASGVFGFAALRGALDPTPRGAILALGAGLVGAGMLSGRRSASGDGSLALACAVGAGGWAALGLAPSGLDLLAEQAGAASPALALWLLDAPLAALGLVLGALVGRCWGGLRWTLGGPALTVGGLAGALLLDQGGVLLPGLAGALALLLLALGASRGAQLGGVVLGLGCLGVMGWTSGPSAERLVAGRYAHLQGPDDARRDQEIRARQRSALAGWSGGVAVGVRAPEETWAARGSASGAALEVHVELDGLVGESPSRAAAAEAMAGLLGSLLPEQPRRALLLGDESGQAQRMLAPGVTLTTTSVAAPRALRAVAGLDSRAERSWLLPGALLRPVHPALALRLSGEQDAIVDIARAPWVDGARAALDGARLDAAARRLGPGGVYLLCLHLGRLEPGAPQALAGMFLERFPATQLWLPPAGADTLLLVGSEAPIPLARALDRAASRRDDLAALGLESSLDLAALALADADAIRAWIAESPEARLRAELGAASFQRPVQHLASLAGHTAAPDRIWASVQPAQQEQLRPRIRAREAFLEVLGEAATGDLEAVFQRARTMLSESGAAGSAALDPLLEPHLKEGREALARARSEGLTSPAWDLARAAAVTAQMLNPMSPDPPELLGDIALAQGNAPQARERYESALKLAPDRPSALTGLARAWRLQGEVAQAEDALRRAARAAPRSASVWQNLGVFLLETGRAAEAEEHLRRAASLDESAAAPHLALAELALSRDDATRALVEVERVLRLENSGYAWYLRGRAHFALEQLDLAEEDFRNAVLADPRLAEARGAIGHIQALRGDLPAAQESFKAVLALQPDNEAARENLRRVTELLDRARPERERQP